jgi:hypothetical protein
MDGACSTHGRDKNACKNVIGKPDLAKDLGVDGKIIL